MVARIFLILLMTLPPLGACQQMTAPTGAGNQVLSQEEGTDPADLPVIDDEGTPLTPSVGGTETPSDRTLIAGAAKPTPIETKGDSVRARPVRMLRLKYGPNLGKIHYAGAPPAFLLLSGEGPLNLNLLMEESIFETEDPQEVANDPWVPVPDGLQVRLAHIPSDQSVTTVTRLEPPNLGGINVSFSNLSMGDGEIRIYLKRVGEEPVPVGAFRLTRPAGIQNQP